MTDDSEIEDSGLPGVSSNAIKRRLMGIAIADIVGFGTLTEGEVGLFSVTLLSDCMRSAKRHNAAYCNTWGDAVIAFFESIGDALEYSLEVRDLFRNTEWGSAPDNTYSHPLAVRIALHMADVFVAAQSSVPGGKIFGTQVSLAARIEPITTPNEVFASEVAVASLKAQGRTTVVFKDLGRMTLPKEDREERVFWVRRTHESTRATPGLGISRRTQVLPTTDAALVHIAHRTTPLRSIRVAVLNGAVSLPGLLEACRLRLGRKCQVQVLAYDVDCSRLSPHRFADGTEREYLERLHKQVLNAKGAAKKAAEYILHASELGAWSNEPQEDQVNRLKEMLSNYHQAVGRQGLRLKALKTPRASVGRCWILDDMAYFTPHFQPHAMAPVLAAPAGSEFYEGVRKHFDYVWDDAGTDPASVVFET